MTVKTDPRQLAILATLVVALIVVVLLRVVPSVAPQAGTSDVGGLPPISRVNVPTLGWSPDSDRQVGTPQARRNLFTYGAPPTPTPDLQPTPTPAPTLPPRPFATPTPRGILLADGRRMPDPPAFPLPYVGWLGPDRLKVAVFRDGAEMVVVPVGEKVRDRFILREITPTGVRIGHTGYPDEVTTFVPLAR
ncbi:MAG: hypothetical protein AB1625_09180 [Acidobacteriota bacterium]